MTHHSFSIATLEDMQAFSKLLASHLPFGMVVFLQGNLGAGKTTFCQNLLQNLGFLGHTKSPTYTLVEPYDVVKGPVYHFDLYRLRMPEELIDLGMDEYVTDESLCLIEWPEHGAGYLPKADLVIQIERDKNQSATARQLQITVNNPKAQQLLSEVMRVWP